MSDESRAWEEKIGRSLIMRSGKRTVDIQKEVDIMSVELSVLSNLNRASTTGKTPNKQAYTSEQMSCPQSLSQVPCYLLTMFMSDAATVTYVESMHMPNGMSPPPPSSIGKS